MLHKQLIAGMQDAAASDHEDGRHGRSLVIGNDPGVIPFAIAAKDDEEFAFGSGATFHKLTSAFTIR